MKKGQVFEGVIEKVAFPNKGHITVDGKTVIVKMVCQDRRYGFL